jgi:hypothetical protein
MSKPSRRRPHDPTELDPATLEAVLVLQGMDRPRMLIALGLRALTADLGTLAMVAELSSHQEEITFDTDGLLRSGRAWWDHVSARLREAEPALFTQVPADPRTSLSEVARLVRASLDDDLDLPTAGLLAACVFQHQTLDGDPGALR